MADVSNRYRKVAGTFTERVEAVPDDRWGDPSPCEGWTARDVVRHNVDNSGLFLGFVGREVPPGPSVDDNPVGAWANARDAVQQALDDPAVAGAEFDGFTGRSTLAQGVDRFICNDLVVHTWDLARASGLDEGLDPDDVRAVAEGFHGFDESMLRSPGVCAAPVDVPDSADDQTKLLAFLGRRA
ncbi:MAG: hypothetical protein QOI55_954 [Actinomycetota bacterium]|nr:hypothetical protein [Actinomycetota bacterium]